MFPPLTMTNLDHHPSPLPIGGSVAQICKYMLTAYPKSMPRDAIALSKGVPWTPNIIDNVELVTCGEVYMQYVNHHNAVIDLHMVDYAVASDYRNVMYCEWLVVHDFVVDISTYANHVM